MSISPCRCGSGAQELRTRGAPVPSTARSSPDFPKLLPSSVTCRRAVQARRRAAGGVGTADAGGPPRPPELTQDCPRQRRDLVSDVVDHAQHAVRLRREAPAAARGGSRSGRRRASARRAGTSPGRARCAPRWRAPSSAIPHQLDADHQPLAADVADRAGASSAARAGRPSGARRRPRRSRRALLQQPDRRVRGGARDGIAAERAGVRARAATPSRRRART